MPDEPASDDPRQSRRSEYRDSIRPAEQPPVTDAMIRPQTAPVAGRSGDGPVCHVCGEPNRTTSSYCIQCGSKLRSTEPVAHMDHGDPIGDAADEGFWDPDLDEEPWNRPEAESSGAHDRHTPDGRTTAERDPAADTEDDRRFTQREPGDTARIVAWGLLGLVGLIIIGFTFFRGNNGPEESTSTGTVATDAASQVYGALITELSTDVEALREQATLINERWESAEADYQETLAALETLSGGMSAIASRMGLADAPADLSQENHTRLVGSAATLEQSAAAMVEGLKAPDTGEARRAALARFAAAATEFQAVADTLLQLIDLTATSED
jgi:hypothetical protein